MGDMALSVRMRAVEALSKIGKVADALAIVRRLEPFRLDGSPQPHLDSGYTCFGRVQLALVIDAVQPEAAGKIKQLFLLAEGPQHCHRPKRETLPRGGKNEAACLFRGQ